MVKQKTPLVSIVLVNWNGLEDTKLCLEHLQKQTYNNSEIIVVDNGSKDGSTEYLERRADILLVKNKKNRGFTGGHIAGYKNAKGKYVLLVNNDAVVDKRYIEIAVAYCEVNSSVGAVGGKAYHWNDTNPMFDTTNDFYAYQVINTITAEGIFSQEAENEPREVNNVSGSCVLVRRSITDKIGYLHDPFFAYYEEADLFARMKRAGYKIIYHPDLAIWHANGKSSERKGSTFSYYMMMRNRFRFAVRNFDNWSLIRFMKFYLMMGLVSSLKTITRLQYNSYDYAYAKAFWRNFFTWPIAFYERKKMRLPFNYNQKIIREQTSVSRIIVCENKASVDMCKAISIATNPWDETIIIAKDSTVVEYAKRFCGIDSKRMRLCVDRDYFSTHSINLGFVSAKGDWVLWNPTSEAENEAAYTKSLDEALYLARKRNKSVIYSSSKGAIESVGEGVACTDISTITVRRSLLSDVGGVSAKVSQTDAVRALLGYAVEESLALCTYREETTVLPHYDSDASESYADLVASIRSAANESIKSRKDVGPFALFMLRHYRPQQLQYFLLWVFSTKVTFRLKVARMKNMLIAIIYLQQRQLAIELKHMRNEVIHTRHGVVNLDRRKELEKQRLEHMIKNPRDTIIFIITRDRLQPLKQLLAWLEDQGLSKIVLVDNDSALPDLMDYLRKTNYQVIETGQNVGHTVVWSSGIIRTLVPDDFYVLSDPDVIPTIKSSNVLTHLYEIHKRYPNHVKIGLGLKIDDLPDEYELKDQVISWEKQFWKHPLEPGIYEAGVDTTFALYKPYTYNYIIHPSIRTGEPYTARHLPWYNNSNRLSDEDIFYRIRADQSVNTWDKGVLPERYIKELEKQRH